MLKPIDLGNGKFGIKEYDAEGSSVGMKEGVFDTEVEAQAFIETGATPENAVEKAVPPVAPAEGTENHDAGTTPTAQDKDHYLEVSKVEFVPAVDEGGTAVTKFMLVNYYLNEDGTKTIKGSEERSFEGEMTAEQVVEKAQSDLIEPGWNIKVVFADETSA